MDAPELGLSARDSPLPRVRSESRRGFSDLTPRGAVFLAFVLDGRGDGSGGSSLVQPASAAKSAMRRRALRITQSGLRPRDEGFASAPRNADLSSLVDEGDVVVPVDRAPGRGVDDA